MVSEPAAEGAVLDLLETLRPDIAYDSDTLQLCAVPERACTTAQSCWKDAGITPAMPSAPANPGSERTYASE